MPDQDAVLALLGERRPDASATGSSRSDSSPLDLLPERDGGERLGAGEDREERVRANQFPALGVGVAAGEVEDEAALPVDGQRRPGKEPQRAQLLAEAALDLGKRVDDRGLTS